jgi:hypothetical protein
MNTRKIRFMMRNPAIDSAFWLSTVVATFIPIVVILMFR